jgi:hypothetical protein
MAYVSHKTVEMEIDGHLCPIDRGIKELIALLNDPQYGLATLYSCQGGSANWGLGYVMFDDGDLNTKAAAGFLILMSHEMDKIWRELPPKVRKRSNFCFQTEISNRQLIRWTPKTYKYVLEAAKTVLKGGI